MQVGGVGLTIDEAGDEIFESEKEDLIGKDVVDKEKKEEKKEEEEKEEDMTESTKEDMAQRGRKRFQSLWFHIIDVIFLHDLS